MVNKNSNNGDNTKSPGTPNGRVAKKQNTRGTPKKNKKNQQEDMEIDSSGGSGGETAIKSPPRMNEGKTDGVKDMMIDLETPPSTPSKRGNKNPGQQGKLVLTNKQKEMLDKWPKEPFTTETIYGEGDTLHEAEKQVKKHIKNVQGCPKVLQYQGVLIQVFGRNRNIDNKIEIQKIMARLLATSDEVIVPKSSWKEGKRPEMSMMNLWVACHTIVTGKCPPANPEETPTGENSTKLLSDKESPETESGSRPTPRNLDTEIGVKTPKSVGFSDPQDDKESARKTGLIYRDKTDTKKSVNDVLLKTKTMKKKSLSQQNLRTLKKLRMLRKWSTMLRTMDRRTTATDRPSPPNPSVTAHCNSS